eukprot:m.200714 g.200714  ORF g.200714 m.200714 type:complete len:405 (-) comp17697_c0_seq3:3028-4242(-)
MNSSVDDTVNFAFQNHNDDSDGDDGGEGEDGIWPSDIETAFNEALAMYPPSGRRKIVLAEEGRMYGRNELIARYIKLKTGKHRSRKQVSSHIQVLARKKQRELSKSKGNYDAAAQLELLSGMSSSEIATHVVTTERMARSFSGTPARSEGPYTLTSPRRARREEQMMQLGGFHNVQPQTQWGLPPPLPQNLRLRVAMDQFLAFLRYGDGQSTHVFVDFYGSVAFANPSLESVDVMQVHDIFPGLLELYQTTSPHLFFLIKFWGDLSFDMHEIADAEFVTAGRYESLEDITLEVSTKVFSLGKLVLEKVDVEFGQLDNGRYVYSLGNGANCKNMLAFVSKLRALDNLEQMNCVLENFTVVQVARDNITKEVLSCIAFNFEVAEPGTPNRYHTYKLTDSLRRTYTC